MPASFLVKDAGLSAAPEHLSDFRPRVARLSGALHRSLKPSVDLTFSATNAIAPSGLACTCASRLRMASRPAATEAAGGSPSVSFDIPARE